MHRLLSVSIFPHIWTDIFSHLNHSDILKCRSVSHEWKLFVTHLIDSHPMFRKRHFRYCFMDSDPKIKSFKSDRTNWETEKIFSIASAKNMIVFLCSSGLTIFQGIRFCSKIQRNLSPCDQVFIRESYIVLWCFGREVGVTLSVYSADNFEVKVHKVFHEQVTVLGSHHYIEINEKVVKFVFWTLEEADFNAKVLLTFPQDRDTER